MVNRRPRSLILVLSLALALPGLAVPAPAPAGPGLDRKLAGFDAFMEKAVRDWNVPGIGVAIVVKDQVVLARGWGYRDYGKKLPFTTRTTVPIASNTKLFTAVAAGLRVERRGRRVRGRGREGHRDEVHRPVG